MKALLLLLTVSCAFFSCKKENNSAPGGANKNTAADSVYSFTYTGTPCVNDTLSFTGTGPTGSVYSWNFGDGGTAVVVAPIHQYSAAGTYTVSLMINDTSHILTKTITIYTDPLYTHLIAGTWTWHHVHYDIWSSGTTDTTTSTTSQTATLVNAVAVAFLGDTLTYAPSLSSGTHLIYTYTYTTTPAINSYGTYTLDLNYSTGAISYSSFVHPGPGEGLETEDTYSTP